VFNKKINMNLEAVLILVRKDFEWDTNTVKVETGLDEVKKWLAFQIERRIGNDLEGFLNALYRLDIDEKKAMRALNNQMEEAAPLALADLILEREWQKVKSRQFYRDENDFLSISEDDEVERW
jgi:hypothetical protein